MRFLFALMNCLLVGLIAVAYLFPDATLAAVLSPVHAYLPGAAEFLRSAFVVVSPLLGPGLIVISFVVAARIINHGYFAVSVCDRNDASGYRTLFDTRRVRKALAGAVSGLFSFVTGYAAVAPEAIIRPFAHMPPLPVLAACLLCGLAGFSTVYGTQANTEVS